MRVLTGLFDASLFLDLNRLPELFCGFARRPGEGPTLYPVACSPQAWAAAAPFMLLQAVLGLRCDGTDGRVRFDHPVLPAFLEDVQLRQPARRREQRRPAPAPLPGQRRHQRDAPAAGKVEVLAVK